MGQRFDYLTIDYEDSLPAFRVSRPGHSVLHPHSHKSIGQGGFSGSGANRQISSLSNRPQHAYSRLLCRSRLLGCTGPGEHVHQAVVAFVASVFEHRVRAASHGYFSGPRARKRRFVVDGELIDQHILTRARKALDEVHIPVGAAKVRFVGCGIRHRQHRGPGWRGLHDDHSEI